MYTNSFQCGAKAASLSFSQSTAMQWLKIWSGVKSLRVISQISKLLTDLVKMTWSLSLNVLWKEGMIKGEKLQGTSLVPSTPQLPHCYLQSIAYKEPVTEAQPHGLTSLWFLMEGLLQSLPPAFCCWPAQPLGSGSTEEVWLFAVGGEEDSPLGTVPDTEMLMRALLS